MQKLTADRENVVEFRAVRKTLIQELERLAEITREYPVVCRFAGYRWIFESKQDIQNLIDELQRVVEQFDKVA